MEPFLYLPDYSLLVCTTCQFATLGDEVPTHLRTRHRDVGLERRQQIIEAIQQMPRAGLLWKQADLVNLQRPGPESTAIAQLEAPRADGLGCRQCPYVARQVQKIQDHCRTEHGWQNERARGGDVRRKARVERALPWREGVRCQRWFLSRAGSHWFEVERGVQHGQAGAGADTDPRHRRSKSLSSAVSGTTTTVTPSGVQYAGSINDKLLPPPVLAIWTTGDSPRTMPRIAASWLPRNAAWIFVEHLPQHAG